MPKVLVNNTDYYYEIHGRGTPVVLIAGYTCDHTIWSPILTKLSENFSVLIFDNRAIGQTVDHEERLTIDMLAADTVVLLEKVGFSKPHLVGHSMGGLIAQTIACQYGDKINKLALLNTSTKLRHATLLALRSLFEMRKKEIPFEVIFETGIPWFYGDPFLLNKEKINELHESILNNLYPQSIKNQERQLEALATFKGSNDLKKIHSPCLIGYGKMDLIVLPDEAEYLASQIPYSILVASDCGHAAIAEIPEDLSKLLLHFFQAK